MQRGFTLLETLIVISLLAILSTLAIPSFQHSQKKNQADRAISQLQNALSLARQTAINQRSRTIVCPSIDGRQCEQQSDWLPGFIAFIDLNHSNQYEPDEERAGLLQRHYSMRGAQFYSSRNLVSFNSYGQTNGTPQTFNYCDQSSNPLYARRLRINLQGRLALDHDATCQVD